MPPRLLANTRKTAGTDLRERFRGCDQPCAQHLQFLEGAAAFFRLECFNRIYYDRNLASAFEQTLRGAAHTKLRHNPKHYIVRIVAEPFDKSARMRIIEDIQSLFLEYNLRVVQDVVRESERWVIRNRQILLRQAFGNYIRARGSFNAVRRERLEFRIVDRVSVTARNQ